MRVALHNFEPPDRALLAYPPGGVAANDHAHRVRVVFVLAVGGMVVLREECYGAIASTGIQAKDKGAAEFVVAHG